MSASFAAYRAASECGFSPRSAAVKRRSSRRGVRTSERSKRGMSTMSTPMPTITASSLPAPYSTVTDFARLRG